MKIAIVDDEKRSLNRLKKILFDDYSDIIEAIEVFNSPIEFLNSHVEFDILFLDIEMPEMTGIELARQNKLSGANIIFVTARDSLVFEAYNATNAIGFVRKQKLKEDLKALMQKLCNENNPADVIVIKKEKSIVKVPYRDVSFIENRQNDIIIHTRHGSYNKRYKMSDLEKELIGQDFMRCHVGYIVNLNFVEYIGEKDITLVTGDIIPISRKRIKEVKEGFLRLNGA